MMVLFVGCFLLLGNRWLSAHRCGPVAVLLDTIAVLFDTTDAGSTIDFRFDLTMMLTHLHSLLSNQYSLTDALRHYFNC